MFTLKNKVDHRKEILFRNYALDLIICLTCGYLYYKRCGQVRTNTPSGQGLFKIIQKTEDDAHEWIIMSKKMLQLLHDQIHKTSLINGFLYTNYICPNLEKYKYISIGSNHTCIGSHRITTLSF